MQTPMPVMWLEPLTLWKPKDRRTQRTTTVEAGSFAPTMVLAGLTMRIGGTTPAPSPKANTLSSSVFPTTAWLPTRSTSGSQKLPIQSLQMEAQVRELRRAPRVDFKASRRWGLSVHQAQAAGVQTT